VVAKPVFDIAKKAAAQCGLLDNNIYMIEEEGHGKYKSIWSLVGKEELEPRRLSPKEVRERTAFMCYSSGTTGRAKGGAFDCFRRMLLPPSNDRAEANNSKWQWRLLTTMSHLW
jgi:acyl-CoA synthetase (AMP-forming)/AMP-acid ligase II